MPIRATRSTCLSRVLLASTALWLLLLGAHQARALATNGNSLPTPLGHYGIRSWQHEHGLPSDWVTALLQTRDGYLWIGTSAGLARYDGIRFVTSDHLSTPEMVNEVCQALAEDREGSLWVGTGDGLLRRQSRTWTRYTVTDGLPGSNIWTLRGTRDGSVWIGTERGLARFQRGRISAFMGSDEPGPCRAMALHEDPDGTLWIGTSRGLFRWNPADEKFDRSLQPPTKIEPYVTGVFRDPAGRLWVASRKSELPWAFMFYCEAGIWSHPITQSVANSLEVRLAAEADGTVWIPTLWNPAATEILWRSLGRQYLPLHLPGVSATPMDLTVDCEGNLWVGMLKGGLSRLTPRRLSVLAAEDGLPHDLTWTVCEARDGSVWIGTDGGVCQWNEGRCTSYTQTNGLSRDEVRALAETTDGTMWVGTLNGLDAIRDGQVSHVRFPGEWFETKIRALLAAHDGALWVGTVRGLTRLHNGERTHYTPAEGLGAPEVRALLEDRAGRLWVGTLGGGLNCLHDGKFTTLTSTNGLSSPNVWALHAEAKGTLWIGTDRGLNRLKDGKITVFTTREGLSDDLVNVITEDDFGRLWIGQDRGIYWVAKADFEAVAAGQAKTVTAVCYDETDGLLSREVNGQKSFPAACKVRDGRLWMATARGVAVINPAKVSVDATPPSAILEEIRANGELVFDNSRAKAHAASDRRGGSAERRDALSPSAKMRGSTEPPLQAPATAPSHLTLPPGHGRVLEFRYTAGAFVAPEKVRFRYRMAGLSPNWIDMGTRREVFFTDLRPGDYEFELIAANHHGVWPERGSWMKVHLVPHLYETAWFWPGVVVLAIAAVGTVAVWRFGDLRQRHALERQAALARERDRIARDMHDDLGAGLTRLVLTGGRVATTVAESETRTAIQRLSREAAGLLDQLGDLVWCTNHQHDTLEGLLARLREHAGTFLEEAGVQVHFDLPTTIPALSIPGVFRRQVFLLFKEILTNITRHAQAREVQISIRWLPPGPGRESRLDLTIRDDGCGFDPAATRQASGNGLKNLRTRVAALGGKLDLQTVVGHGATIRVALPLQPPTKKGGGRSV